MWQSTPVGSLYSGPGRLREKGEDQVGTWWPAMREGLGDMTRFCLRILLVLAAAWTWGCGEDVKKQANDPCAADNDCASTICHKGICAGSEPKAVGAACTASGDCYARRVSLAGTPLDKSKPIEIISYAQGQWYPAPAFDGTNVLTVWTDQRNYGQAVFGGRITP